MSKKLVTELIDLVEERVELRYEYASCLRICTEESLEAARVRDARIAELSNILASFGPEASADSRHKK